MDVMFTIRFLVLGSPFFSEGNNNKKIMLNYPVKQCGRKGGEEEKEKHHR